ncbi:MAG: hypothetical protein MJZ72_08460 [Bacteroidales bacterium]|nr:hypothetical protein [Bacteroidales bacterium]
MSILEYLNNNTFYSLPEILNLHHGNPLGLTPVAELIFIFVVVAIMGYFNHRIRYYGKSQYYPVLYTLLAISTISIFYYCFQADLPTIEPHNPFAKPCIGWFCYPDAVGWTWAIIGIAGMMIVIYNMLIAVMQTTAEMSVHAKLIEGKPWKEWKWAVYISLFGVAAIGFSHTGTHEFATWTLIITQLILLLFVIGKIIFDSIRCKNALWGISIGLVFYISLIAIMMLTTECMYGTAYFFVGCLAIFSAAKARKKNAKKSSYDNTIDGKQ